MGLRIIYGRSGTGKSEYCFLEIAKKIESEEKIIIITPEQFSFTLERKLMETINRKAVLNAEIITLSRMAYRVLQEIGKTNKTNLSKCGKAMLIYSILHAHKKDLKYLGKTDENIDIIMRAITEFKQHNISIDNLKDEIERIDDIYLQTKLQDIEKVYGDFENHIKENYIDETDKITILAQELENTQIVKSAVIYIDEFAGFTSQEYDVIRKLVQIAKQVNITVCTDNLNQNTNPDIDIFYSNKKTIQKLWQMANEYNLEIEEAVFLENAFRFKSPELNHLEKNIFEIKFTKYEKDVENISIFLAKNQYAEIEEMAKKINKIVREDNLRYKDISVITKNIETYASLIKGIFGKYEIPVFIDEKRELNQNIIVQYILSILEVLSKNYSNEAIFNYLKLGFLDYEDQEIFDLESYCTKWGITRNKWKEDFTKEIEKRKQEIERLNTIRKEIITPLENLRKNIVNNKTATSITKHLYQFIQDQKIEEKISEKIKELEEKNLLDLVQEYKTTYDTLIEVLDQIVLIFGDKKLTIEKYLQILKIGLKNSSLGKIPGTQDQVIIGDVERSRSHKVKVVFIIGLNDGIFPSVNKDEGFLDDLDREILKKDGLEIAKGTLENLYEENFNIYKAFSTAEEKIFLSYSSANGEGKTLRPSIYINKIKKMFPKIKEESDVINKKYEVNNKISTYEYLIENISKVKEQEMPLLWQTVYKYFENQEEWKIKLEKDLQGLNYINLPQKIDKDKIETLYGDVLKTSVSRLEKYKKCAFSYFLQYGLRIKEKEELKVHNFDTGSFMHEVIDDFFTEAIFKNDIETDGKRKEKLQSMEEKDIEKYIDVIVEEKLKLPKNYIFNATAKYKMLVKRLKRVITKALKYIIEGLINSDFNIQDTEVEFGEKGNYKPIIIELEDGKKVEITGKIDRIDTAKSEDGNYLRIIDYKSSAKNIDLNEVYQGLQIQLLTYMDAVCKEEDFIPAGILYFGLLEQMIKADKKITEEEIEEKMRKDFKMKGLILADVKVIKMQDNKIQSGTSNIIPAGITKDGNINQKNTNGVNSEDFKVLQKYIPVIIKQIAKEMLSGNIELKPYNKKGRTPCEYCEYKSICGFDTKFKENKYNYIDNLSNDEIIKKMKEG